MIKETGNAGPEQGISSIEYPKKHLLVEYGIDPESLNLLEKYKWTIGRLLAQMRKSKLWLRDRVGEWETGGCILTYLDTLTMQLSFKLQTPDGDFFIKVHETSLGDQGGIREFQSTRKLVNQFKELKRQTEDLDFVRIEEPIFGYKSTHARKGGEEKLLIYAARFNEGIAKAVPASDFMFADGRFVSAEVLLLELQARLLTSFTLSDAQQVLESIRSKVQVVEKYIDKSAFFDFLTNNISYDPIADILYIYDVNEKNIVDGEEHYV